MQSCEDICLFCDKRQCYKVNKTFWHGVCEQHKNLNGSALRCGTCSTIIDKIMYIEVYECQSCFLLSKIKSVPCGHQVCKACSDPCKFCENISFAVSEYRVSESITNSKSQNIFSFEENNEESQPPSPAFKTIESERINNSPLVYLPDENPNYSQVPLESNKNIYNSIENYQAMPAKPDKPCDSCINMNEGTNLTCKHFICKECFNGECPICSMLEPIIPATSHSNMSSDKMQALIGLENNKKWCVYCTQNLAKIVLPCSHYLCENCYKEPCQMCLLLTLRSSDGGRTILYQQPLKCISCDNTEFTYMLDCGHSLCKNCDKGSCGICLVNNGRGASLSPGSGRLNQNTLRFSIGSSKSSELIADPPGTNNQSLKFKDNTEGRTISSVERFPSSFNRSDEYRFSKENSKLQPIVMVDKEKSVIRPGSIRNHCDYCLGNEFAIKNLPCEHNICIECSQDCCPLCDLINRNSIYEASGIVKILTGEPPIRKASRSLREPVKNLDEMSKYSGSSLYDELAHHSSANSQSDPPILPADNPVALVKQNAAKGKRNEGQKQCCDIA